MFTGELPGNEPKAMEVTPTKVAEKPPTPPATPAALPPRMRKTWSKILETSPAPAIPLIPRTHQSVGVQCDHTYDSHSVQTPAEPAVQQVSSSVQTEAVIESQAVAYSAAKIPSPIRTEEAATIEVTACSAEVPPSSPVSETYSPSLSVNLGMNFTGRDRSLSPMELDSPGSSPTLAPTGLLTQSEDDRPKSMSLSPPGLSLSTSSSSSPPGLDVHLSPLHLSPDSGDPPGLAIPAYESRPPHVLSSTPTDDGTAVGSTRVEATPTKSFTPTSQPVQSSPTPPGTDVTIVPNVKQEPAPYKPKRKPVLNPFVSGGLLTDFVSGSVARAAVDTPKVQSAPKSASPSPNPEPAITTPIRASHSKSLSPTTTSRAYSPPTPPSASSSKVKVEDIPPEPSKAEVAVAPLQCTPLTHPPPLNFVRSMPPPPPPRPVETQNGPNDTDRPIPILMPPRTSHGFFPPGPSRQDQPNGRQVRRTYTPPSDSKPPSFLPSGSFTNPLNIRPSGRPFIPRQNGFHQPQQQQQQQQHQGNGWPYNRQGNSATTPSKPPGGNDNLNNQQRDDRNANINRRASWGQPAPAAWPQPPPPGPPAPGPGIWPQPPASYDRGGWEEEYDPRNPMNGFAPPPPPPRDNMYPPPNITPQKSLELISAQYSTPQSSRQPSRASSISDNVSVSSTNFQPDRPPTPHYPPPINTSFIPPPPPRPGVNSQPITPTHPLPPKPSAFPNDHSRATWSPRQGVKRMASLEPISPQDNKQNSMFSWPTIEGTHTSRVKGEEEIAITSIVFNSDGTLFALTCSDRTVRIWNNRTRLEIARLGHTMSVLAVAWLDHDSGVVTLGDNGIVSTWTRNVQNKWQWAKILDAGGRGSNEQPTCLAFGGDRIAIAFPQAGVKVWLFVKGTWFPQRSILQHNVSAIKFVDGGDALIGATGDGVLWHCEIPNGTLKVSAFLKSKVLSLDVEGRNTLVALAGGRSQLLTISSDDHKGTIEQTYYLGDPELQSNALYDFGALFANRSQAIIYGAVRGCLMVWDRSTADVSYGMAHGENDQVLAISSFEGGQTSNIQIITGTRNGRLTWFTQPAEGQVRKRVKVA
ncbi:unnamed protein product [Somion occarium]